MNTKIEVEKKITVTITTDGETARALRLLLGNLPEVICRKKIGESKARRSGDEPPIDAAKRVFRLWDELSDALDDGEGT